MRPSTIQKHRTLWAGLLAVLACHVQPGLSHAQSPAAQLSATNDQKLSDPDRAAIESLGRILVDAVNASTDDQRRALIREAYDAAEIESAGIDRIAAQLARIGQTYPGLIFDRSELTEHNIKGKVSRALHVYARRPGDKLWRDLQLYISEGRPFRLTRLVFIAEVTQPIALPNGNIDDPATLAWLNEYVNRLVRDYDLSGATLIASGDKVIFERYFGFADAARAKSVGPDTLFGLASASKMFTALGIARLVADGKLSFDDTLSKFFPEFPDQNLARQITIRQLLSHSSGLTEYWNQQTAAEVRKSQSTQDLLPLVLRAGKDFDPGTRHAYSNSNFVLAGIIIERVSQTPFDRFIDTLIFQPLAMSHTGYFLSSDSSRPLAEALSRDGQAWKSAPRNGRGTAAGGCFSTARDMLRFMRGLIAGKVIPQSMLSEMTSSKVSSGVEADSDYGYGFILEKAGRTSSFGHGGITAGVNAEIRYFPSLDITMILLNNQDNGAYDDLRKNITNLITGQR